MMEVVNGIEAGSQHFATLVEMTKVGPGIILAGITAAGFVRWAGIVRELAVADLENAIRNKQETVPRVAGRHDAIEHVDSAPHSLNEVLGSSHTH
jgi:hypothetical protein